jgi:hypothetical protein
MFVGYFIAVFSTPRGFDCLVVSTAWWLSVVETTTPTGCLSKIDGRRGNDIIFFDAIHFGPIIFLKAKGEYKSPPFIYSFTSKLLL